MNSKEKYKRLLKFGASIAILAAEMLIYWFVWTNHYNRILSSPFWRRGNWLMMILYAILLLFFLTTYGGFRVGYLRKGNLIYSQLLSVILANIIEYIVLVLIDKKMHNPYMLVAMTAVDAIVIVIWAWIFQTIHERLFPPRSLLVVYGDRPVSNIFNKINSREDKFAITGAISIDKGVDAIVDEAKRYGGIIIGDIPAEDRNEILKRCYELSIRTYMVPKISDILIRGSSELNLFDTQLLLSRNNGLQADQRFVKRMVDIILSTALLIITSPLFLIFAIAIKCEDAGPVFYRQPRLTIDGKIFDILKFRTMRANSEHDGVARLASKEDNRITKVGKILRSIRLDELPQLVNIIIGDMSLVGPRPERPEIAAQYMKEIPEFSMRLKVKAGLTGYAQIYGKYNTTPYDKLKLDMTYIRNYSLWLDIKLIIMTPKVMFMKESTEGIDDGQATASLKEEVYGRNIDIEKELNRRKLVK